MAESSPGEGRSLKRALRLRDLVLLNIVAVYTPATLAQNMPLGRTGLLVWGLAILAFMLPCAAAVASLSRIAPREGGIYAWTHLSFGDFHGFLCGWCYWVNTFLYVPSVFLGIAAVASLLGGERTAWLNEQPLAVALLAIGTLWIATLLHLFGLREGAWLQNLGAIGRIAMAAVILIAAIWKLAAPNGGGAGLVIGGAGDESLDFWRKAALWPFTLNALVGLDLGAAMSDEADAPSRDIPRSLLIGGAAVGSCYLVSCAALLVIGVPGGNIIYGHVLAVNSVLVNADHAWTALLGLLIILCELAGLLGSGAAWLAAPARIPFAIGIDRYLPRPFASVHPRFGTPWVALLTQAVFSTLLILVNIWNATLQEAYLTLLGGSILLVLITYLYLFTSWRRIVTRQQITESPVGSLWLVGTIAVSIGIITCFIPPPVVGDALRFEARLVGSVLGMLACGMIVYFRERYAGRLIRR